MIARPGAVDLSAIRERSERCEQYRDDPKDRIDKWALAAVASAADVPALISAVESLRIQRDNAEESETTAHEELARVRKQCNADLNEAGRGTLAIVCLSVYVCFRGIAWVIANGWRSMLGLVALRGEAVISFDDHADSALEILLTHEAGVVDGAPPERWIALEEEFADLDDLAAQLGERAS